MFAPLALLLAGPLIGLALVAPVDAAVTALIAAAAAGSTALLNLWHPMPGKRAQLMRRHSQSKIVGLMEHMMSLCWAVTMVATVLRSPAAILPVFIVAAMLWFNRPRTARAPAPDVAFGAG